MNILQLNTSDIEGGAARAAYRIHKAIIAQGVDSEIFVQSKQSDDYTVKSANTKLEKVINKLRPYLDRLNKYFYKNRQNLPWSANCISNSSVVNQANGDYNIVHMHWVCGGFFSIGDIAKINKPIVWTLHDSWAFTGGCHIPYSCDKYVEKCFFCEQLDSKKENDLSYKVFQNKLRAYETANMTIVTPSIWLANCAKKSFLFKNKRVEVIPNCLDITTYQPLPKTLIRKIMNIDKNEKVIAFGAMSSTSDRNKGFNYLKEALRSLKNIADEKIKISVIIFGASNPKAGEDFGFQVKYMGRVYDDISLATIYNCADVMVSSSLSENLPNVIMESLACGTPCVAFDIGGMPDMITHKVNGYLAQPFNAEDLARGIHYVLEDEVRWQEISVKAREHAVANYAPDIIANKYINLYNEILNG